MTYSAVDDVGEAYEATRSLLWPVDPRRWLVLAVVVVFVSGVSGFDLNGNHWFADVSMPPGTGPGMPGAGPGPLPDLAVATLVLVVAAAVAVALAVAAVAAVMEFVFVRILERRDARVRAYLRQNVRKGLSLFSLRLLVGLAVVATVTLLLLLAASGGVVFLAFLLLLSPVFVVGVVVVYVFHRFTVDFVVPVMLVDDVGVLAGWRRFLPEMRSELPQYGVYALVRFGIGLLAAMVTAIGFIMVAIVVGIPFAVVALAFYLVGVLLNAGAAVTTLLWVVVALYAVAVFVVGVTLVQVPVSTYLRYYSLLVLADVSPDYDLVSDVRAHLGDEAPPTGGGGDGSCVPAPGDPDAGAQGDGDDETGGSEREDAAMDDAESENAAMDDAEQDAEPVDGEAYRTETEEPERYGTDEDDGR